MSHAEALHTLHPAVGTTDAQGLCTLSIPALPSGTRVRTVSYAGDGWGPSKTASVYVP